MAEVESVQKVFIISDMVAKMHKGTEKGTDTENLFYVVYVKHDTT